MTRRRLAVQIVLAALVLLCANLGVRVLARNSIPRQLLYRADAAEPATDLFLGNSTMAAGLDESAFAAARAGHPLNLGLGASGPVEHALIYRQQAKHAHASVYYGFLGTQLTELPSGGWADLVGNRAMAYYVEPDIAIQLYAPDSRAWAFAFRLVARVPILVERLAIWAKVERFRRRLSEIGLAAKTVNRFGRVEDFTLLEEDTTRFALRCEEAVARHAPLNGPILAILDQARRQGCPVTIVEMPMPTRYRTHYYTGPAWRAYRALLIEQAHTAGARYVSAAEWIGDESFADALHLNEAGAREFSTHLAQRMNKSW